MSLGRLNEVPTYIRQISISRAERDAPYLACEIMCPGVCRGAADHFHHRRMRSQGGGHSVSNSLMVCHACHDYLHKHTGEAYARGWLVRGWKKPGEQPVLRRGKWVVLNEHGTWINEKESE